MYCIYVNDLVTPVTHQHMNAGISPRSVNQSNAVQTAVCCVCIVLRQFIMILKKRHRDPTVMPPGILLCETPPFHPVSTSTTLIISCFTFVFESGSILIRNFSETVYSSCKELVWREPDQNYNAIMYFSLFVWTNWTKLRKQPNSVSWDYRFLANFCFCEHKGSFFCLKCKQQSLNLGLTRPGRCFKWMGRNRLRQCPLLS